MPGHAGHDELTGREVGQGRGEARHGRTGAAHPDARLDDPPDRRRRQQVLADERDGPPGHRLGGVVVAVAVAAGQATEERAGRHPAAVVLDGRDGDGGRVTRDLEHVDLVEQQVHLHRGERDPTGLGRGVSGHHQIDGPMVPGAQLR